MHDSSRAGTSFCLERSRKRLRLPSLRCATAATRGADALVRKHLTAFNCCCLSASGTPSARLFVALSIMPGLDWQTLAAMKWHLHGHRHPVLASSKQMGHPLVQVIVCALRSSTRFEHLWGFLRAFQLPIPEPGCSFLLARLSGRCAQPSNGNSSSVTGCWQTHSPYVLYDFQTFNQCSIPEK